MDWQTSQVLMTGATSPAGRRVLEALFRGLPGLPKLTPPAGLRVRCLALPGEDFAALRAISDRVQILVGDLCQSFNAARLCQGARGAVLLHLALARDRRWSRELRRINADATTALLEAAAKGGVRRAVVLSDAAVCAGAPGGIALDESVPATPLTAFGRSVAGREAAALAAKEIETVVLRCAPLIAPASETRRPLWFECARGGVVPASANGAGTLSLASLDTLAQAVLRAALAKAAPGQTFWVAEPAPFDLKALCETLRSWSGPAEAGGTQGKAPGGLALRAAGGRWLSALGIGFADADEALAVIRPMAVSTAKAAKELKLRPTTNPETALRSLWEWKRAEPPRPPAAKPKAQ